MENPQAQAIIYQSKISMAAILYQCRVHRIQKSAFDILHQITLFIAQRLCQMTSNFTATTLMSNNSTPPNLTLLSSEFIIDLALSTLTMSFTGGANSSNLFGSLRDRQIRSFPFRELAEYLGTQIRLYPRIVDEDVDWEEHSSSKDSLHQENSIIDNDLEFIEEYSSIFEKSGFLNRAYKIVQSPKMIPMNSNNKEKELS